MALESYRAAASGRKLPAFAHARSVSVGFAGLDTVSDDALWDLLETSDPADYSGSGGPSLLDVKAEIARRILRECRLCERRCGVNRLEGETGFCGVGRESRFFFEQILWGEEAPLVPSHEVFLSGCNMRCKYCYSADSNRVTSIGAPVRPLEFAELIARRRLEGALNLNLIGGEPTVHLSAVLEALRLVSVPTPIVWNSNFYMSAETMRILDGMIDLYLGDFRFGNDRCAADLADTDTYFETAARNFELAAASGDLIIRHLVVPGHVECCLKPIAEWVAERLPETPFNLMFQYTPFGDAPDDPVLCRSLTPDEESRATEIVSDLKLNTSLWNRPLRGRLRNAPSGVGEISTTVTINPDGRVGIMHLHRDLLAVVESLGGNRAAINGEEKDG